MKKTLTILILLCISNYLFSQHEKNSLIENMKKDVTFLASDQLKGRKIGTKGERQAAQYIKEKFQNYGLEERGSDGYYQIFKTNTILALEIKQIEN